MSRSFDKPLLLPTPVETWRYTGRFSSAGQEPLPSGAGGRATAGRDDHLAIARRRAALGRLGAADGLPISRLMRMVEDAAPPLVRAAEQESWEDAASGFLRRDVSPPAEALSGHVIEGRLRPGAVLRYETPPVRALEHHLVLREGGLVMEVSGTAYRLEPGDCLRYRLDGPTAFRAGPDGAAYLLFML